MLEQLKSGLAKGDGTGADKGLLGVATDGAGAGGPATVDPIGGAV